MFNALKYTSELEKVGFTREQAELSINILVEIMDMNLASKQDLKILSLATREDFKELSNELRNEMIELRTELKGDMSELRHEIRELESRMVIKLGSLMVLSLGLLTAINKLV